MPRAQAVPVSGTYGLTTPVASRTSAATSPPLSDDRLGERFAFDLHRLEGPGRSRRIGRRRHADQEAGFPQRPLQFLLGERLSGSGRLLAFLKRNAPGSQPAVGPSPRGSERCGTGRTGLDWRAGPAPDPPPSGLTGSDGIGLGRRTGQRVRTQIDNCLTVAPHIQPYPVPVPRRRRPGPGGNHPPDRCRPARTDRAGIARPLREPPIFDALERCDPVVPPIGGLLS